MCSHVTSRHLPTNNPVIIAKLRLGFQVSGFEYSEEFARVESESDADANTEDEN